MDKYEYRFTDGAEVFECNGRAVIKYNARIKRAGDSLKVQFYENGIMRGYPKNKDSEKAQAIKDRAAYDPAARFAKTGRAAARRLYDYVQCNIKRHPDHNGKKQTFKFLTLTFREDVREIKDARREFRLFVKRLNYFFTGDKKSTFLKWVAVPELQKATGRNVWHFHALFFNLPFIPVSLDKVRELQGRGALPLDYDGRDTLFYLWGNGNVDVKAVKFSDAYDVAGYVAKYVGKGLEGDFCFASENGLVNGSRFLHSAGLFGPEWAVAFMTREQRAAVVAFLRMFAKHAKRRGELGLCYDQFMVSHEYIGRIFGVDVRASLKRGEQLFTMFQKYSYGFL